MTYYQTATSPLVFATQKAEKVEEWMITQMLETLLRREYEIYDPKEAAANLNEALNLDQVFSGVIAPPTNKPKDKEVQMWVEDFLMSEAGQRLLSQVGQPLHKQTTEEQEVLSDETTLSDLLPSLTIASEWDSEGPELHSQMSNPQSNEA
jgi:hypothetical protein